MRPNVVAVFRCRPDHPEPNLCFPLDLVDATLVRGIVVGTSEVVPVPVEVIGRLEFRAIKVEILSIL